MKKFLMILMLCVIMIAGGKDVVALGFDEMSREAVRFITEPELRVSPRLGGLSYEDSQKSLIQLWKENKIPEELKPEIRRYMEDEGWILKGEAVDDNLKNGWRDALDDSVSGSFDDWKLYMDESHGFTGIHREAEDILRQYVADEDWEYAKRIDVDFYFQTLEKRDEKTNKLIESDSYAYYDSSRKDIFINPSYTRSSIVDVKKGKIDVDVSVEIVKGTVHHEVSHAKDYWAMDVYHYNKITIGRFDKITSLLWSAITEGRAHSEQMVFMYKNMEETKNTDEKERWTAAYKWMVENTEKGRFFDTHIKEFNGDIEKARHATIVDLLNSCYYVNNYLVEWAEASYYSKHLAPETIISIVAKNDDKNAKLTLDDLYSAKVYWTALCSYDDLKNTNECKNFKERVEYLQSAKGKKYFQTEICTYKCENFNTKLSKYIKLPDQPDESFDVDVAFRKLDKIFEVDKTCTSDTCKNKGRILTTKDDEDFYVKAKNAYRLCCSFNWNIPDVCSASSTKSLNDFINQSK